MDLSKESQTTIKSLITDNPGSINSLRSLTYNASYLPLSTYQQPSGIPTNNPWCVGIPDALSWSSTQRHSTNDVGFPGAHELLVILFLIWILIWLFLLIVLLLLMGRASLILVSTKWCFWCDLEMEMDVVWKWYDSSCFLYWWSSCC